MHEMSIVMSIVELSEKEAEKNNAKEITQIELEIGELAGIDWPSLEFAWEPATRNTILEKAERKIIKIKGMARCVDCDETFEKKELVEECPSCGSYFHAILKGKELRIKTLTIV